MRRNVAVVALFVIAGCAQPQAVADRADRGGPARWIVVGSDEQVHAYPTGAEGIGAEASRVDGRLPRSAGDVDGDGRDELLVSIGANDEQTRLVWLGDGGVVDGPELEGFARGAGDVDGDGYGDLAAMHADGLLVWHGGPDGPGEPHLVALPGDHGGYRAVYAGDVDGDGFGDLIFGGGVAQVAWGGADGLVVGEEPRGADAVSLLPLLVAELDRQPGRDVIGHAGEAFRWFSVTREGAFEERGALRFERVGAEVVAVDVDDDGDPDLATVGAGLELVTNDDGVLGAAVGIAGASGGLAGADVDHDGYGDVVTGNPLFDGVSVFAGGPGGLSVEPAHAIASPLEDGVLFGTTVAALR